MAEVDEECEFHTCADQIKFLTRTNGDKIIINGLSFTQMQAASLAWLVNAKNSTLELEWSVKIKEA